MEATNYLARVESSARTYASSFPKTFVTGRGIHIRDSHGCDYIDCLSCAGALPLGHNHPEIKEAVLEFVSSDQIQQGLDLATPSKFEFVRQLFSYLPPEFRDRAKIQFCGPTGSDAVEAAFKLMKYYTQRTTILAFHGGYHGMTQGALAAMGNLHAKAGIGFSTNGVHFAPYPYRFRCPFGTNGDETDKLSINYIRTILSDPEGGVPKPAAVIAEAVQGEGGNIPASEYWLQELRQLTYDYDVPLIIDEVQTGLGRTGVMFAFERAGITPDALVLSKAVGGGYPLSVVVYDKRFDIWPRGMHAGTFRGNQIAMVAGCAAMRVIERDGLALNSARMGGLLKEGIQRIARRVDFIGDVRGQGLMVGVEVVKRSIGESAGALDGVMANTIKRNCFENGLIVETGGRNSAVLRFIPPLIVSDKDIDAILDRFERAIKQTRPQAADDLVTL